MRRRLKFLEYVTGDLFPQPLNLISLNTNTYISVTYSSETLTDDSIGNKAFTAKVKKALQMRGGRPMAPLSLATNLSCYGVLAIQIEECAHQSLCLFSNNANFYHTGGMGTFSALDHLGCVFTQSQCNIQLKGQCRSPSNSLSHRQWNVKSRKASAQIIAKF